MKGPQMDLDPLPDQPTPMKQDPESSRLLEGLHAARRDQDYLFEPAANAKILACRFDSRHRNLQPPLSPELQALIQRTEDLERDWDAFDAEAARKIDEAAWRFAAHVFDLHPGDRILCNGNQGPIRLLLTELFVVDHPAAGLLAQGFRLRRDGTPGKRIGAAHLMQTPWRKLATVP